jgi:cytoskeletal protein CcmA (bactofilin family)
MFTFRPGKNGAKNGNGGIGNGHNGQAGQNGHGYRNGNGNGHTNGQHGPVESVIGPGVHWKGALSGAGGVRIEGSFDGSIKISGPLVVAEGAKVTAEEIRAQAVSVAGTVKANIVAEKVEILATGRIYGDLTTRAFASEEGAFLRGQIVMQDEARALPEAAEPAQA